MSAAAWALVAVVAVVAEVATLAFVALYVAVGALAAALAALVGVPVWGQVAAFGAVTLAGVGLTRGLVARHLQSPAVRGMTGLDDVVGRRGVAVRDVDDVDGGIVRVGSEMWSAAPYAGVPARIPAGTTVEVLDRRGLTLFVAPADRGAR
jgi:membrane protein implicated in regulation of membrane protease activity